MGLVVWLCTVIAERLNQTRIGRMITTGVAVFVITYVMIIALALINLMVFTWLGI